MATPVELCRPRVMMLLLAWNVSLCPAVRTRVLHGPRPERAWPGIFFAGRGPGAGLKLRTRAGLGLQATGLVQAGALILKGLRQAFKYMRLMRHATASRFFTARHKKQ